MTILFSLYRAANNGRSTDNVRSKLGTDRTNPWIAGHLVRSFTDSFKEILIFNCLIITRHNSHVSERKKTEYKSRQICGREIPGSRKFPRCYQVLSRPQIIVSSVPRTQCEAASAVKSSKIINLWFLLPDRLGFSCFLVVKGLLCNLGSLSQEFRLLKFDRPKTGSVRAKACLTGQCDRRLPVSYLQPCSITLKLDKK